MKIIFFYCSILLAAQWLGCTSDNKTNTSALQVIDSKKDTLLIVQQPQQTQSDTTTVVVQKNTNTLAVQKNTQTLGVNIGSANIAPKTINGRRVIKDAEIQTIVAKPSETIYMEGKQGTKIAIAANSLVFEDGTKPTGNIEIRLQEYYKPSDMYLAGLTTTSDGQWLESGGMVNVTAWANGKQLRLADNQQMLLQFANADKNPDMKLFYADTTNNAMNWKLQTINEPTSLFVVGSSLFCGDVRRPFNQIYRVTQYDLTLIDFMAKYFHWTEADKRLLDREEISIIETQDSVTATSFNSDFDARIKKLFDVYIDSIKTGKIKQSQKIIKYWLYGENLVNKMLSSKPKTNFADSLITDLSNKNLFPSDEYVLVLPQMGWNNFDAYLKQEVKQQLTSIQLNEAQEQLFMIAKNKQAIINSIGVNDKKSYFNVIKGLDVLIVANKFKNNKIVFAVAESNTNDVSKVQLNYNITSTNEVSKIIDSYTVKNQ